MNAPEHSTSGRIQALLDLFRLPRAFWVINLAYALDMFCYSGVLALLNLFLTKDLGVADKWATIITGTFAAAVTLFMFGFGSYSERFGIRRALVASFVILLLGRVFLGLAGLPASFAIGVSIGCAALAVIAIGEGVLQTANFSGLKQYSDDRTSAAGFGLNYAFMNAGSMAVGLASPVIRVGVDDAIQARIAGEPASPFFGWIAAFCGSGVEAVLWMCAAVSFGTLILVWVLMTPAIEQQKLRPEDESRIGATRQAESSLGIWHQLRNGPFGDARFTFFVFMLLPARTLFAHQIHTITLYIARSYPKSVQDRNEWFSLVFNPLVVCLFSPVVAALTRRMHIYKLMLIGTIVTALPTFLLCLGERWELLLTYIIIFSIGEVLWQPRFYQFAADLAPEGKMGSYMAAASIPWLIAKFGVGLYAGLMLESYCPETGPRHTGTMWAINGAVALISPIGLWFARDWLRAGLQSKPPATGIPIEPAAENAN